MTENRYNWASCEAPGCNPSATPHRHTSDGLHNRTTDDVDVKYDHGDPVTLVHKRSPRSRPAIIGTWTSYEEAARWMERTAAHIRQAAASDAQRPADPWGVSA